MLVKDLLDGFDVKFKLPQHWYSTEVSDDFEQDCNILQSDEGLQFETLSGKDKKVVIIDIHDGMSVYTEFPDGKVVGVKYLKNKDDFEYIGKPSQLYFDDK